MTSVSIIVPVYNTEKYLRKCLDSLVNQTLYNIEILVVNDGSTDNSQSIIDEYKAKYPIIKALKKENGGLSDARNYAFSHVKGEYIGFVDSDDYVENNMFEKMYNVAKQNNLDIVECNFTWEYPKKSKVDYGQKYINYDEFYLFGRVMACNKIFRTSAIKENKITFPVGLRYEDIEFFYKLTPYVTNTTLVEDSLYHYVQRNNSIINNQNAKTEDIFVILDDLVSFYKEKNIYQKYIYNLEYLYIRFLMGSSFLRMVKIKDRKTRKKLLEKSFNELNEKYPNWKENKLLEIKSKKNFYYKTINKFTFKIYSFIFRFI